MALATAHAGTAAWARSRPALRALALYGVVRAAALVTLFVSADRVGREAAGLLVRWDGRWYARIAAHGYGHVHVLPDGRRLADYAFFPLYPGLERVTGALTGLDYVRCGLLISFLAAPVAALGIFRVVAHVRDERTALLTVALWGSLPVAAVQTLAYTESLFTAIAAWCLYAVLRGRWVVAGALSAAAALTRPTGVALSVAVAVAVLQHYRRRRRATAATGQVETSRAPLAGLAVAAAGAVAYPLWVAADLGTPTAYFRVTGGWRNELDGGAAFATWVAGFFGDPATVAAGLLLVLGVAGLAWLLVACVRQRLPAPWLVYTTVLLVLSFGTSGYFGSKPRYLVPAFVLLVPVAGWLAGRSRSTQALAVAAAAVSSAAYGAVWLLGPGPP